MLLIGYSYVSANPVVEVDMSLYVGQREAFVWQKPKIQRNETEKREGQKLKGVGLDKRELSVTELYLGRLGLKVWGSMAKLQSVRPSCQSLFREKE